METQPKNSEEAAASADGSGALTPRQELALQALLSHPTLKEAAAAAGISEPTLWRYKKDPEFARRLRELRRQSTDHTVTRLQQAAADAVTVLHDLLLKEAAPPASRISAARTVLDYSFRAGEVEELRAQVEELQEFLREKQLGDESAKLFYGDRDGESQGADESEDAVYII